MKATKSKFYGIKFPFFGLKRKPFEVLYTQNGIDMIKEQGEKPIILDRNKFRDRNYLNRLIQTRSLEDNVIVFDLTARTLEELIHSDCKWGVDSMCNVFDLSKKETYTVKYKKIRRIEENYFWLDRISYPFQFSKYFNEKHNLKNMWVGVILVDFYYVIYDYDYFPQERKKVRL